MNKVLIIRLIVAWALHLGPRLVLRWFCFSQVFFDSFDENWDGRWVVSQSSDYGGNTVNLAST